VRAVTLANLDTSWYRSVNEFARDTSWAHSVFANYANWAGLVLLALLLVTAWLLGRRRPNAPRLTATAFLVGLGAVLALLANQAIGRRLRAPVPVSRSPTSRCCCTAQATPRSRATTR
jgi:hypothetical protein